MNNSIEKMTRAELLALPEREWNKVTDYDYILLIPAKTKHDSGYAHINIIGVKEDGNAEMVASRPDDIAWITPTPIYKGCYGIRTDCFYKSKALRFWSGKDKFRVYGGVSSIDISLVPRS